MSMRGSARQQPCEQLQSYPVFISSRRRPRRRPLQGDVQEEGQGEEWSDAGRHPPWHLPAANVLRPNHIHGTSHMYCLRLFSIQWINHSDLCLRLLANSPWGVCGQNITETAVLSSGDGVTFPDDRFLASSLFSSFGFCLYQFVFSSNFSSNFSKNVCKEQREVWYV